MGGKMDGTGVVWMMGLLIGIYLMEVRIVESENEVYQKEKLLGQGAFGKAYLVRRKQTGELLVIKEVSIDHMSQKEQEETIKQAQILRTFKHPLIVRFVEVYATKQNKLKIVMEYAECGDLSKAIATRRNERKTFEENQILDWFTQICLAMKHVHDRKILHRDIKGQNIFITKANTLKLGDFGIARVLNKTQDKARTVVGTPYYLSPEIIENKPYSFKSDIWSMGVLLYELCALAPPFNANSLQLLALKIVKGGYQPITTPYSKELKGLIADILQVDPNRRPSIRDILERPFIKERIQKFLSETSHKIEFSHTILHNHKVEIANKLIKVQEGGKEGNKAQEDKRVELQRMRLKEEAAILKEKMDRKKEQERTREEERLRRRKEEELLRRQEQSHKRKEQELKMREQELKRAQMQRKLWIEKEKKKQEEINRNYQQEQERKRVLEIAQLAKKREKQEKQMYARRDQLMREKADIQRQRQSEAQARRRQNKEKQEVKRMDQFNQFARKQWYQNQMIRKRAEERAKQSQMDSYASEPSHTQEIVNKPTRPQSIKEDKNKRDSREKKPYNQHEAPQKRNSVPYEPSQQELQNALLNPNFNKKSPAVKPKINEPKPPATSPWGSKAKEEPKEDPKAKKVDDTREQMKRDREQFLKAKNQSTKASEPEAVQTLKPGKWDKRPSKSRERQEQAARQPIQRESPARNQQESVMQSADLRLNIKDEQQFNDYLAELQGLLGNINKNMQKLDPLPELPVEKEILMRDDDNEELDYSITASFDPAILPPPDDANADFDLFSDYSKLQELRMSLEDKFGTDNFIKIYRVLEGELQSKGLQYFNLNISDLQEKLGKIDKKLLLDNLPMLLTLIVMEEKMS